MSFQSSIKCINTLTLQEKTDFLQSFDLIFCDCDGVIWHNLYEVIPGAAEAIKYLRDMDKKVIFVTNNSIVSTKDQLKKFASCGIDVKENELVHPAKTICDYLKSINFDGLILCFGSSAFKEHLRQNGFQIVEEKERLINGSLADLRNAIYSNEPVKAVIIDVDFNLTAWKLMRAQVHLKNPQCLFIAGAADPQISFGGNELLGPGSYIRMIEDANHCKAKIFGKPGIDLKELLKETYHISDSQRVLIVGDSLKSDIKFGNMCGFQTLLVLSGGTLATELDAVDCEEDKPDFIIEKLADLNNLL